MCRRRESSPRHGKASAGDAELCWAAAAEGIRRSLGWDQLPPPPLLLSPVPQVFGKVAEEKKGKVQVFFCGSPALAKVVRAHCERFGFRFFKENF